MASAGIVLPACQERPFSSSARRGPTCRRCSMSGCRNWAITVRSSRSPPPSPRPRDLIRRRACGWCASSRAPSAPSRPGEPSHGPAPKAALALVLALALLRALVLTLALLRALALLLVLVLAPVLVLVGSAIRAMRHLGWLFRRLRPPRRAGSRVGSRARGSGQLRVALLVAGLLEAEVPGTGRLEAGVREAGVLGAALHRAGAVAGLAERGILLGFRGVAGPRPGGGRHRGRGGQAATLLVSSRPLRWSPSTW